MTTAEIAKWFLAGLTMEEVARKAKCTVLQVEKAIRRWMVMQEAKS